MHFRKTIWGNVRAGDVALIPWFYINTPRVVEAEITQVEQHNKRAPWTVTIHYRAGDFVFQARFDLRETAYILEQGSTP